MLRKLVSMVVVMLVIGTSNAVDFKCPVPGSILPCECESQSVTCKNITDFAGLRSDLDGKLTGPFTLTVTFKSKTAVIEKGLPADLDIVNLFLYGFAVEFSDHAFVHLKNSLRALYLRFSWNRGIPVTAISKLDHLRYLEIQLADLNDIRKMVMDLMPKTIEELVLDKTQVGKIDSEAFVGLSSLKTLSLEECDLKTLPAKLFPVHIESIKLRNNSFSSVPMESFKNLANAMVDLRSNKIVNLPKESLMKSFLSKGNSLSLTGNKLQCGCDLKWIPQYKDDNMGKIGLVGTCSGDSPRSSTNLQDLEATMFSDC